MKNLIISIIVTTVVLCLISISHADDLDDLKQVIKTCDSESCRKTLQKEAEQVFETAGGNFKEDFVYMGNDISLNHCQSIIREIFYHMEKMKSYHNFTNVFYLKKLKNLKENRDRLGRAKISADDFTRLNQQVEEQYNHDIKASQGFIDEKAMRLKELCSNLRQNTDSVLASVRIRNETLSDPLKQKILFLKNEKIWMDFVSNASKQGRKIRNAVLSASNGAGKDLMLCLMGMFSRFDASGEGTVFSPGLLERIEHKTPKARKPKKY